MKEPFACALHSDGFAGRPANVAMDVCERALDMAVNIRAVYECYFDFVPCRGSRNRATSTLQTRSTSRPVMSIDARLKAVQSAACPNPSS